MNVVDAASEGRLLIANYHRETNRAMECMLWLNGYDPQCVETNTQAKSRMAAQRFGLLISRNSMPDGDAAELIQHAWARYGTLSIALTGTGTKEEMTKRVACDGLRGVLVMPFSQKEMLQTVGQALGRKDVGPAYRDYVQASAMVACPDCRGTGQIALLVHCKPCAKCGGQGKVPPDLQDMPIRHVHTIPPLTRFALHRAGLQTLREFKKMDRSEFQKRSGLSPAQMESIGRLLAEPAAK